MEKEEKIINWEKDFCTPLKIISRKERRVC
jgi:hypothetical protein